MTEIRLEVPEGRVHDDRLGALERAWNKHKDAPGLGIFVGERADLVALDPDTEEAEEYVRAHKVPRTRSISARSPNTTARAASSSSRLDQPTSRVFLLGVVGGIHEPCLRRRAAARECLGPPRSSGCRGHAGRPPAADAAPCRSGMRSRPAGGSP